jgi:hypothetical protein
MLELVTVRVHLLDILNLMVYRIRTLTLPRNGQ